MFSAVLVGIEVSSAVRPDRKSDRAEPLQRFPTQTGDYIQRFSVAEHKAIK